MFSFAWPYLFLLLPMPFISWKFLPKATIQHEQALRVPNLSAFQFHQASRQSKRIGHLNSNLILLSLIWVLLLTAAAKPQWVGEAIKLPVSGRDLLLAVDLSGSMEQEDMQINNKMYNRLTATKLVLSQFIQQRKGDRLGLILFADHAYLQTPLTYDSKTIETMLIEAELGLAGKKTAIGEAIGLAIKRIKDLPSEQTNSRVMVLLTDGANTAGIAPLQVAKLAKQIGLKIYTIGFGADELIVRTIFGREKVNPSRDLDEKTLKSIAEITGGQYYRARDTESLKNIYATLNKIEPIESDNKTFRPIKALYFWPLGLAFILSMLIMLISFIRNKTNH